MEAIYSRNLSVWEIDDLIALSDLMEEHRSGENETFQAPTLQSVIREVKQSRKRIDMNLADLMKQKSMGSADIFRRNEILKRVSFRICLTRAFLVSLQKDLANGVTLQHREIPKMAARSTSGKFILDQDWTLVEGNHFGGSVPFIQWELKYPFYLCDLSASA